LEVFQASNFQQYVFVQSPSCRFPPIAFVPIQAGVPVCWFPNLRIPIQTYFYVLLPNICILHHIVFDARYDIVPSTAVLTPLCHILISFFLPLFLAQAPKKIVGVVPLVALNQKSHGVSKNSYSVKLNDSDDEVHCDV
jgi:hypothetical protein